MKKIEIFGDDATGLESGALFIAHTTSREGRPVAILKNSKGINDNKLDAITTIEYILKNFEEKIPLRTIQDFEEILCAFAYNNYRDLVPKEKPEAAA